MIPILIYTTIMTALFCYVRTKENSHFSLITKSLASLGFVMLALYGLIANNNEITIIKMLIVLGLILGLIGDIFMDLNKTYKFPPYLRYGMSSFLFGHLCFIVAIFFHLAQNNLTLSIPNILLLIFIPTILCLVINYVSKLMKFNFGTKFDYVFSLVYITVLSFTAVLGICITLNFKIMQTFAIGIILFLLSDLTLSNMLYGKEDNSVMFHLITHITYYCGQCLIAITLFSL